MARQGLAKSPLSLVELAIHRRATGKPSSTEAIEDLQPDGLGLRGMYGNVWEWTSDCFEKDDPDGPIRCNHKGGRLC